ncbi:hypothetical protein [Arthrobacter sp. PsM3]|nr:hypothetical protein [Arthrobacter sp. PsM3]MDN4644887.1 hypothetical protein [Arthrobacter sp. PsM3]
MNLITQAEIPGAIDKLRAGRLVRPRPWGGTAPGNPDRTMSAI